MRDLLGTKSGESSKDSFCAEAERSNEVVR